MKIDVETLVNSILEFISLEEKKDVLHNVDYSALCEELRKQNLDEHGKWFNICELMTKNYSVPVIKQHIPKCNKLLLRHFEDIKKIILSSVPKNFQEEENEEKNVLTRESNIPLHSNNENENPSTLLEKSYDTDDPVEACIESYNGLLQILEKLGKCIKGGKEDIRICQELYDKMKIREEQKRLDKKNRVEKLHNTEKLNDINCKVSEKSSLHDDTDINLSSNEYDNAIHNIFKVVIEDEDKQDIKVTEEDDTLSYKLTGNEKIVLPASFLNDFWSNSSKLKSGWTSSFNDSFAKVFPKCILVVKKHTARKNPRQNAAILSIVAKCKNSHCVNFVFKTFEQIEIPYRDVTLNVTTSSENIYHKLHEIHCRHVTGQKRQIVAKQLELKYPCKLSIQMLQSTNTETLDYGNHNDSLSKMILQKISSENNAKDDLASNFQECMGKLIDKSETTWKGEKFNGYIQAYSFKPFYSILFTERQLKYVVKSHELRKFVFLYDDSTGTIVGKPPGVEKQIYYYALCLPGEDDIMPLPVAEFVSSVQSITFISLYLQMFCTELRNITNIRPLVHKLETDFSMAIIQAATIAFNQQSLTAYLNWSHSLIENNTVNDDHLLTISHICSSHVEKTVLKKSKKKDCRKMYYFYDRGVNGKNDTHRELRRRFENLRTHDYHVLVSKRKIRF